MYMDIIVLIMFSIGVFLIMTKGMGINSNKMTYVIKNAGNIAEEKISGFATEFKLKKNKTLIENEIYQSASLLENIIILQKESPKGAVYLIEQISSYSKELKRAFESMLYYMRLNQNDEAVKAFANAAGTKTAKEYGDILVKMDSINPSELRESISLLRRRLREEAITREKRKNEIVSDLIYIPVLANVMLIFVNFIYISYYAEQKELFQQLLF